MMLAWLIGFSCLLSNLSAFLVEPESDYYQTLKNRGFLEIGNLQILQEDYQRIYRSFDRFIDFMSNDESFFKEMRCSEQEFTSFPDLKLRYCETPPSFRDPQKDLQKKHAKVYFQFIKEHYELLKRDHSQVFQKCHEFLDEMIKIDQLAREYFALILKEVDHDCPQIKESLQGNYQELTIVSKIVRYNRTESWGTTPHFDKSGLTLIWDSSDASHDSLVLCTDVLQPSRSKLAKPLRKFSCDPDMSSVLLIPGACFLKIGIDLKPTLHGVLPFEQEYRYAIISFALIPDINTRDVVTDFFD